MKLFDLKSDLDKLYESGRILSETLKRVSEKVVPGVTTKSLDNFAEELIRSMGAIPAFLNYKPKGASRPFPATLCLSINDEIVHGIPNENRIINNGDIVSVDCGVQFNKIFTDAAVTVACGEVDLDGKNLISATKKSLERGIKAAKVGKKTGDIGDAIEKFAKKTGYKIADDLGGHGVGFSQHEDPFIPNWSAPNQGPVLVSGQVIAIEPMLNEGSERVVFCDDGYTVKTFDGKRSAHFEHTVLITNSGPVIITK